MDFLLECIGFPPDTAIADIVDRVMKDGEPAVWRGDADRHRRLALGGGLEVRIDKEPGRGEWGVLPHFQVPHRLRVAVEEVRSLPDSPFDALILGWAAPPIDAEEARLQPGAYRLSAFVTDARRLPRRVPRGHVLALSIAGYALDVSHVGPGCGPIGTASESGEAGPRITPLGSPLDPGGCSEVSVRIERILHLVNPITGIPVEVLEVQAPERPLQLFISRWQLEKDALPLPRPGWRIEGTFFFSGRIAGGLPGPRRDVAASFG